MAVVLTPKQTGTLVSSSLFAQIRKEDALAMMHCLGAAGKHAAAGEFIFSEGDPSGTIGLVLEGSVRILRDMVDGNRTILSVAGEGELFAEAFACAGVPELPVSVQAVEDTELLLLDLSKMLTSCSNACAFHQMLIRNLLRIVAQNNLRMNQKLRILSHRTTRDKLLAYLGEQAKARHSRSFTIPFDRQGLADYLGVERSAMSAELGKLRKEGLLETKKNHFILAAESSRDQSDPFQNI